MTILECIKEVLAENGQGLTSKDIHTIIVERNLYSFGAEHPVSVVNSYIRRRCLGLDFPTSYPDKIFEIVGYEGKKPKYALLGDKAKPQPEANVGKKETADRLPEEKITEAWGKHIYGIV